MVKERANANVHKCSCHLLTVSNDLNIASSTAIFSPERFSRPIARKALYEQ